MDPGFDLTPGERAMAAQILFRLLAETALLGAKTRGLCWRLEGPALALAEGVLAAQRRELFEALDPLARRLRALGFRPPLGHADLARAARGVADAAAPAPCLRAALEGLARDHGEIAGAVRFARPVLQDVNDGASVLLLDGRLAAHECAAERLTALCVGFGEEVRRLAQALEEPPDRELYDS